MLWHIQGFIHRSVACHIQRVNLYRQQGDKVSEADALAELGRGYDLLGDVDEAIESCEHSLAITRRIGDRQIESKALIALGTAYGHLGYAQRTVTYSEQALSIARKGGNW